MNESGCKWCDNGPIVWIRIETKDDGPWHIDELGNRVERCTRKLASSEGLPKDTMPPQGGRD